MRPGSFLDKLALRFKRGTMDQYYGEVFGTPAAQYVLADLCREGGLLATTEGLSGEQTLFQAGKRHMVTHILAKLRALPEDVQRLGNLKPVDPKDEGRIT